MPRSIDQVCIEIILECAKLLGKSLDPAVTITNMLDLIATRLGLVQGQVALPGREAGELSTHYSSSLSQPAISSGPYPPYDSIGSQVMQQSVIAIVPRNPGQPVYLESIGNTGDLTQLQAGYIAVPIVKNDTAIGTLTVHTSHEQNLALSNYLHVLQVISAMIGQVLQIHNLVVEHTQALETENEELKRVCHPQGLVYGILGRSPLLNQATSRALKASQSDASVMLTGESGVGKERFARMIHLASERRDSPFVCVNCAAIPEQLLETELFGHEKGAFTGADKARYGKFELASDGTVFLDEIGDMNLELQAKLLRVLQEKSIQRVGSNREIKTNVRVIAATNINLDDAINQGAFRLDLYYRLNVIRIQLPPLRERDGDIRLLANYFLNRENQRYKRNIVFAPSALNKLEAYTWPGNIRQLENVVERAVIMAEHDVIYEDDIDMILQEEASIRIDTQPIPSEDNNADMDRGGAYCDVRPYSRVRDDERKKILQAIRQAKGNKTRAARDLGLTARQLRYRLEKLQLN